MNPIEHVGITCPHCWQRRTIAIDTSGGDQTFIQDCEVCCNPLSITIAIEGNRVVVQDVEGIDQ